MSAVCGRHEGGIIFYLKKETPRAKIRKRLQKQNPICRIF
jgi:hypothetical protein